MRIGFSFNHSQGGPANFMNNLRESWNQQGIAKTSLYINPFNDCNVFANRAKVAWLKQYFIRIDGIIFDLLADPSIKQKANEELLRGAKKSQGVIFQSFFSKQLFETILGYYPQKQTVIHNGTNQRVFNRVDGSNIRHSLGIPDDAFVFVTSAKWRKHKRLDSVIESFVDFRKRHTQISTYLMVIGDYEDLNIENVLFLQHIDNKLLPHYYSAANVYLFYSWLDNCPNSVVEAISCGLPTICTNQGGTHELVEMSHGGIVVDADKPFLFKEVELYNPPMPDMHKLSEAMDEMYNHYNEYANHIQRQVLDIDYVSRAYYDFIKGSL